MKIVLETNVENWRDICSKLCTSGAGYTVNEGNAGLDVPNPLTVTIPAGQSFRIHLGVKIQPDADFRIIQRSSITKTPLRMTNPPELIDKSYREELVFCVKNTSARPKILKKGKRICQIVSEEGSQIHFSFGKVNQTKRGAGGFGSTVTEAIVAEKISEI